MMSRHGEHYRDMKTAAQEEYLEKAIGRYSAEVAATARAGLRKLGARFPGARRLVYERRRSLPIGFAPAERGAAVFSLVLYPRWVRFFFLEGVAIDDPEGRLEGTGSQVRSIRVDAGAAIFGRNFRDLDPMAPAAGSLLCGAAILIPLSVVVDQPGAGGGITGAVPGAVMGEGVITRVSRRMADS